MSTTVTKLYLVRHAEAEGNLYRRIHGQYDSLVTDNGYRQIAALAHRFEDIPVDAVYSSDLFRTRTTARAIYEPKGLPLTTRKALREVSMGVWEDRTWPQVARTDAEQLRLFNATDARWQVEGGETFQALRERVPAALRQIVRNHPGQTVAVVCHGTAIRNALAVFQGLSIAESAKLPHSDNTAVSLLEFQGEEVRVVFHDDASHLPEEISTFAKQRWWKQDTGSMADANLWFRPLDMEREEDFFRQCRGEAWLDIHGSWDNYDGDAFAADALAQWRFDHNSVIWGSSSSDRPCRSTALWAGTTSGCGAPRTIWWPSGFTSATASTGWAAPPAPGSPWTCWRSTSGMGSRPGGGLSERIPSRPGVGGDPV